MWVSEGALALRPLNERSRSSLRETNRPFISRKKESAEVDEWKMERGHRWNLLTPSRPVPAWRTLKLQISRNVHSLLSPQQELRGDDGRRSNFSVSSFQRDPKQRAPPSSPHGQLRRAHASSHVQGHEVFKALRDRKALRDISTTSSHKALPSATHVWFFSLQTRVCTTDELFFSPLWLMFNALL